MTTNIATATFSRGGRGGNGQSRNQGPPQGFQGNQGGRGQQGFQNSQGGRGQQGFQNNQGGRGQQAQMSNQDQMMLEGGETHSRGRGHRRQNHRLMPGPELSAEELMKRMQTMLDRRYNQAQKLLDLSAYEEDPEFANSGVFTKPSTRAKFFPALMKVCENIPKDMVTGVILSNNKLQDLNSVSALPQTFPDLQNLDLSNNEMINLDALWEWRRKLLSLEHLIISGNPLEKQMKAGWEDKIKRWYQKLRILNTTEVRPADHNSQTAPGASAPDATQTAQPVAPGPQNGLVIPPEFGMEAPGKAPDVVQKELMTIQVSRATNMTLQSSAMCLEQAAWDIQKAEQIYLAAKPTLPPDAFFIPN